MDWERLRMAGNGWERLRMAENDWERLGTPVFFKGSRCLVVSWSRGPAVPWSCRLVVSSSRWRATQSFSAVLSLSQSFSSNRAPPSQSRATQPFLLQPATQKKIGASQTRGSEVKVIFEKLTNCIARRTLVVSTGSCNCDIHNHIICIINLYRTSNVRLVTIQCY